jgi:hypothetical protein
VEFVFHLKDKSRRVEILALGQAVLPEILPPGLSEAVALF